MNFFGLQIGAGKQDQVVVRNITPNATPISKIKSVKPKTLGYNQSTHYGRGHFRGAEYDLSQIGKIEDTDGYVARSFNKKLGLMFKEGYGLSGPNKTTVRYIKARLAQIAQASDIPTDELLSRTAASLIRTSNAFWVKARDSKASGGRKRETADSKDLQPIAAYFPAAPETMRYEMEKNTGRITKWRQHLPDGQTWREFSPDDVIHFSINRREGFIFGVPYLIPVIDDIRALRQIEENVELLLYQYLFPLFHYKVGTESMPAGYTEDGMREIEVVQEQIRYMPSEGALVTPERHEITAVGAEGRALRAEGYLDHFKKRVFAGLGISQVDMGDGNTANRATAQTMSRALIDTVKSLQDAFECQFNHKVISELLLESTFGNQVLESDNLVYLEFKEIDIQNKMDQNKHNLELFIGNAITWDELRQQLGLEPIPVPEDPEDQDPSKYPEWFNTYWKLFGEPENLIRAVDEPYSVASKIAAESRSMGATTGQISQAQKEKEAQEKRQAEANKSGQNNPRARTQDNALQTQFSLLETDTATRVRANLLSRNSLNEEILRSFAINWAENTSQYVLSAAAAELLAGFNDQTGYRSSQAIDIINIARDDLRNRIHYFVNKLAMNVISLIKRRVDSLPGNGTLADRPQDVMKEVHLAFDAVRFRTAFIWDVELRKAYNYGRILGMRLDGVQHLSLESGINACQACQSSHGRVLNIAAIDLDDVPPLHPNSRMTFSVIDATKDVPPREEGKPAVKQDDPSLEKTTAVCPDCGNSMVLQRRSATYYCMKCNMGFSKQEIKEDKKNGEA